MKLFLKGLIIGIGKILPGISGSVLAISLNEYNNIIYSFCNIKNHKNVIYLIKICSGVLISIIFFSKILYSLFYKHNIIMTFFFIGLIISTLPGLIKKINKNNYIYSILGFIILSLSKNIKGNFITKKIYKGIYIGVIESISTIIPGISGTALLTNFNLYSDYLLYWSKIYDIKFILSNITIFISIFISLIITSVLLIFFINNMLEKHKEASDGYILGFVLASTNLLIKSVPLIKLFQVNIIFIIMCLLLGILLGYILENTFK